MSDGWEGLAPGAVLRELWTGGTWLEGPLWIPDRGALRFSDIPGDRVLEYLPASDEVRTYAHPAEFANGRCLDREGRVVQCSHGRRAVELDDGRSVSTLVDRWQGARLNSPNDVVVASDGSIWFTDPAYGITVPGEGHLGQREYDDHYVFRLDPSSGSVVPVVVDVEEPNGLAFSPDESLLYVADSSGGVHGPPDGNRHLRVYDVDGLRRCKNGRFFADVPAGVPDGLRVDHLGRVWTSCALGVVVLAPDGRRLGLVEVPQVVSNLCFGGPTASTLYITATTSLYAVETQAYAAGRPTGRSRVG